MKKFLVFILLLASMTGVGFSQTPEEIASYRAMTDTPSFKKSLFEAAIYPADLRREIRWGLDPNLELNGYTLLQLFTFHGKADLVTALLESAKEQKKTVDLRVVWPGQPNNLTTFFIAVERNKPEILKLLIQEARVQGILPELIDAVLNERDGVTLLMYAVDNGRYEIVNILVEAGVDIKKQDTQGNTACSYMPKGDRNSPDFQAWQDAGMLICR